MRTNLSKKLLLGFYVAVVFIAFLDTAIYLSMSSIWFFLNKRIVGMIGISLPWAYIFLILFCAAFSYSLVLLVKVIKARQGVYRRSGILNIVLPVFLIAIFSVFEYYLYTQLESSQNIVLRNLISAVPWILATAAILFFVILYPNFKISRSKTFKYVTATFLILVAFLYITNFAPVGITSGPVIQLVDDTHLSIVWTTDKKSTGYVEYGPNEKSLKREIAAQNGLIAANTTVHKVIIPIDTQSEFLYRVGSTKINQYFQNNIIYGNTVVSSFRRYKDYRHKENVSFYVLSDIHENTDLYNKFLKKDDYDFVVFNGDMVNSVDSLKVIENDILKPVSTYTNGTKPFYLVRGNHETRGAACRLLTDYISLPRNNFYYTFHAGPVYAVVLDSAEDKPDSHEEYAGLAAFEKYLGTETAWLQSVSKTDDYKKAKYKLAFVHIPLNDFDSLEDTSYLKIYQDKWRTILSGIKIDAVFSGHTHSSQVIKADNMGSSFETFIGGGDSMKEKSFAAVKVEAGKESMKVYYIGIDGAIVGDYEIKSK